jgi:hypothetical protein
MKNAIKTGKDTKQNVVKKHTKAKESKGAEIQRLYDAITPMTSSQENLTAFANKKFQAVYESLGNEEKISFLKELWTDGDLPAKQLVDIGYDALAKISPTVMGLSYDVIYRVYFSDKKFEDGYHTADELGINFSGSWTTSEKVAEFFMEHTTGGRYSFLWSGAIPKYGYLFRVQSAGCNILWTDDSREEDEVVIGGIKYPTQIISVQCFASRKEYKRAA